MQCVGEGEGEGAMRWEDFCLRSIFGLIPLSYHHLCYSAIVWIGRPATCGHSHTESILFSGKRDRRWYTIESRVEGHALARYRGTSTPYLAISRFWGVLFLVLLLSRQNSCWLPPRWITIDTFYTKRERGRNRKKKNLPLYLVCEVCVGLPHQLLLSSTYI